LIRTLRGVVGCDIEVHLHNDTGMGTFCAEGCCAKTDVCLSASHRKCVHRPGSWCNSYRHLQVYPRL
jgi:hypothetical protein